MRNSSENGFQLISLVLKPDHFVLEIILEGIGMQTVILGSKHHAVPLIKLNVDLMERIVMAVIEDQDWQSVNNAAKDGNPRANIDYLDGALYYKGRRLDPSKR
jgi:hypothetical protein